MARALSHVRAASAHCQVKAIVATQRDYGRRDDRRQARLKYLVHEWGVDRFRWVGGSGALPLSCVRMGPPQKWQVEGVEGGMDWS